MAIDPATISAIGTGLSGVGSLVGAFSNRGDGGISWNDFDKTAKLPHEVQNRYADYFQSYAKKMGVSPYALLGHQMPSGGSMPAMSKAPSGVGDAMRKMGQDVQRGVNNYIAVKDLESRSNLQSAQADYYTARAAAVRDTQRPNSGPTANDKAQIKTVPKQVVAPSKGNPGISAGGRSAAQLFRRQGGEIAVKPSESMAEASEEQSPVQDAKDFIADISREYRMSHDPRRRKVLKAQYEKQLRASGHLGNDEVLVFSQLDNAFRAVSRLGHQRSMYRNYRRGKARGLRGRFSSHNFPENRLRRFRQRWRRLPPWMLR